MAENFVAGQNMRRGPTLTSWWIAGIAFVLINALRDFLRSHHGLIVNEVYWGRDFINVWTGGQLIRQGRLTAIYDLAAYNQFQHQLFGPLGSHNYSYPPVSFPIAASLSFLPYPIALATWIVGTGALFVWAAKPWWPERAGPAWLAIATPAALINVWMGHYGFLIGALFLLGWQRLDDKPRQAGIFFGLMLIKPHLAVLIPLVLLIRRKWQAIGAAAATVAVLVGLTTIGFGWQLWHDYLFNMSGVQASMIDAGKSFFGLMSCSAATMVLRDFHNWPLAITVQAIFSLSGVILVAVAAWRRVPTRELSFLVATATFLVLPYSFSYDLTVVAIGTLAVLTSRDAPPLEHRLALYGFLGPQIGIVLAALGLPGLPLMLAGVAAAQFRLWVVAPGKTAIAPKPPPRTAPSGSSA